MLKWGGHASLLASKVSARRTIVSMLFIAMLLCTRGMLLGNTFGLVVVPTALLCICLTFRTTIFKPSFRILAYCLTFFGYCICSGYFAGTTEKLLLPVSVFWIIETIAAFFVLETEEQRHSVGRIMIVILEFCSLSYIVTFILAMLLGWNTIQLSTLDLKYSYQSPVFFPFTIAYGDGNVFGVEIYRLQAIGRECGISQTLYIWSYYKVGDYFEDSHIKWHKILLLLSILFCMSTTGIAIFVGSVCLNILTQGYKRFSLRTFALVAITAICIAVLLTEGTFSVSYRMNVSYSDRNAAIEYGLNNLKEHPWFGVGFLASSGREGLQTDICLLASLGQIGLIGFGLFLLPWISAFRKASDKRKFLLCNCSLFITTMIAQPIFYSPLIYLFLFDHYDLEEED